MNTSMARHRVFQSVIFDPRTQVLACDLRHIPKRGADFGTPPALPITAGEPLTVRLFYNRSVLEVYAAGHFITSRLFPDAPATMKASINAPLIVAQA